MYVDLLRQNENPSLFFKKKKKKKTALKAWVRDSGGEFLNSFSNSGGNTSIIRKPDVGNYAIIQSHFPIMKTPNSNFPGQSATPVC